MSNKVMKKPESNSITFYKIKIPIRGYALSLQKIKKIYQELQKINTEFGKQVVASLKPSEDMTDEQWQVHKERLLENGFRLTVTIRGERDQEIHSSSIDGFEDPNLPNPIRSIYFTNLTAYRNLSEGIDPRNRVEVYLDFSKPELFDPDPLLSAATYNESEVAVTAEDITFFYAVQTTIDRKLSAQKTWYSPIHGNFVYDAGLWLFALPIIFYIAASYMDRIIPASSDYSVFRWPFFIYVTGILMFLYRAVIAYTKWAFPVNILKQNEDAALKHRLLLGVFILWLLGNVSNTVYGFLVSQI